MSPHFRVYTNPDITGVELGGALKNVIAIGAGLCEGLGTVTILLPLLLPEDYGDYTSWYRHGGKEQNIQRPDRSWRPLCNIQAPTAETATWDLCLGRGKVLKKSLLQ